MVTGPVLAHPNFYRQIILDINASFDTIGAVLSQKDILGKEKVIAYES